MSNIDYTALGLPTGSTATTTNQPASVPTVTNGYISMPFTANYLQLIADCFAFIAAQIPGWSPSEGQLEVLTTEVWARMVTVAAQVAAQVPLSVFTYFGAALMNLPPEQGTPAQADTTWTMVDDGGYTVPAGTGVYFQTGTTATYFQTAEAFSVPAGSTQTAPGAVTVVATTPGTANNGIAAGALQLVDSLAYVASVTSTGPTSGGADPETTGAYLNRLSNQLQLLTPRPILGPDFALLTSTQEGVGRAVGIDNFDAAANLLNPPDDSFETGIGTWAAGANTTVETSTLWAEVGSQSLALVGAAAGAISAQSGLYPVSAGQIYTAMATGHAVTAAQTCSVGIAWYDLYDNWLSTSTGTPADDSTAGGVNFSVNAQAPSNATQAAVVYTSTAAGAGDTHLVDCAGLFYGSPSAWSAGGLMSGVERCVTVVPVDVDGNALSDDAMSSIGDYLQSLREVNFLVFVVPPTYTQVTVSATVVVQSNADPDSVQAAVTSALQSYLSPGVWAGGAQTPPVWLNDTTVYLLSVASVFDSVAGVHHIEPGTLLLNGAETNVTLAGFAPLPVPAVSVAVTIAPAGT